MKKSLALFSVLIFLVSACGGSQKKAKSAKYKKGTTTQKYYPSSEGSLEDVLYENLEHRRGSGVRYSQYIQQNGDFDIPYTYNPYVQKWIDYFTGRGRGHFERYLTRLGRFMPYIHAVTDKYGLPRDLVYLSMIESGFNIRAKSWASAVGPWQFIRSTGAMYGLDVDYYMDERMDVEKSTHAAAQHLKDLHDEFGDWYLAFAAYNAGAGKVRRAINLHGTNFWDMVEGNYLRQETKDYVPKILAAALISKNPQKYGFSNIRYQQPINFEKVELRGPMDLEVAAECAGVDPDLIRMLNPELLRDMTPPHVSNYALRIPKGTKGRFEKKSASLNPSQWMRMKFYEVGRNDSVESIASRYGVKVADLVKANPDTIQTQRRTVSKKVKVATSRKGKRRYQWQNKSYTSYSYSVEPGAQLSIPNNRSMAGYSSSRDDEAAYRAQGQYGLKVSKLERGSQAPLSKKEKKKLEKAEKEKNKNKNKNKKKGQEEEAMVAQADTRAPLRSDLESGFIAEGDSMEQGGDPIGEAAQVPLRSDLHRFGEAEGVASKKSPMNFASNGSEGMGSEAPSQADLKDAISGLVTSSESSSVQSETPGNPKVKVKRWVPEGGQERVARVTKDPQTEDEAPAKKEKPRYHVVKSGDTLQDIARKYGVSAEDLRAWNGKKVYPVLLKGAKIQVGGGEILRGKGKTAEVESSSPVQTESHKTTGHSVYYTVRSGDSLTAIAKKNGVSPKQLKEWNGAKVSPVLQKGAQIVVKKESTVKYKVKPGDSLTTIARKYSMTPEQLRKLNGLKTHVIQPGAILVVQGK